MLMTKKIKILTHRGLEPNRKNFFKESSYEAFENHLKRGFGIELDVYFSKNNIFVSHDSNLKNKPKLTQVLNLIKKYKPKLSALHVKGAFQNKNNIDNLINILKNYSEMLDDLIIFDITPDVAKYIKKFISDIHVAPSLSHEYDIERYNKRVGGTLLSVDNLLKLKDNMYDWAWLDEWDLRSKNNLKKKFYTEENFKILKEKGIKIALVSPELHSTSPGLLGNESHENGLNKDKLFKRIKEIIKLKPDAICTDYPEEVKKLI